MQDENFPVTLVILGDLHLTKAGVANHVAAIQAIDEVNTHICRDFVQFIGDNVQDATDVQFELFRELCSRLTVPWFALVGDHDVKDDPLAHRFCRNVTGRYTAVPVVYPAVNKTAFC